jgi:hypothetical protein
MDNHRHISNYNTDQYKQFSLGMLSIFVNPVDNPDRELQFKDDVLVNDKYYIWTQTNRHVQSATLEGEVIRYNS